MQLQLLKRIPKHKLEGFGHNTPANVRGADIIAEISIPEPAEKYLTQGNRAHDCTILYPAYQQADGIHPAAPLEEHCKLFGLYWWRDKATMQAEARTIECNEL